MLIPKDLETLELTLAQVRVIIELRRRKAVLANRLKALPAKEQELKQSIVRLDADEKAAIREASGA